MMYFVCVIPSFLNVLYSPAAWKSFSMIQPLEIWNYSHASCTLVRGVWWVIDPFITMTSLWQTRLRDSRLSFWTISKSKKINPFIWKSFNVKNIIGRDLGPSQSQIETKSVKTYPFIKKDFNINNILGRNLSLKRLILSLEGF